MRQYKILSLSSKMDMVEVYCIETGELFYYYPGITVSSIGFYWGKIIQLPETFKLTKAKLNPTLDR
jgi:hypothetical protein